MPTGIDHIRQYAAAVVVQSNIDLSGLASRRYPWIDAHAQIDLPIGELNLLYVDEVVDTVTGWQFVCHAHHIARQMRAVVFGCDQCFDSSRRVSIRQHIDRVAFLRARELHRVLVVPRIAGAAVGTAVVKVVAQAILNAVTTSARVNRVVACTG